MASKRPFQILALPLVRIPHGPLRTQPPPPPPAGAAGSSKPADTDTVSQVPEAASSQEAPLTLYLTQQPASGGAAHEKPPVYQRALDKAVEQWDKLGEKPKGSWMRYFHTKGESLMDKIEFEEWALKNVKEGQGVRFDKDGVPDTKIEIPLLRPAVTSLGLPPLLPKLHRQLLHRIPYHKKMMTRCLVLSPLTWPFAIIPVIPNFPLFYVLWRAWSHYKAWRGATYLDQLLKAGMIVEEPSAELDRYYAATPRVLAKARADAAAERREKDDAVKAEKAEQRAEEPTSKLEDRREALAARERSDRPEVQYEGMMLTHAQIPDLERSFGLSHGEGNDIGRAVEQADERARKAVSELQAQAKA